MVPVEPGYGLVGRDAVLRETHAAIEELTRGRGRFVLFTGEPGMGKSALLRVAADLAAQRGMAVFVAQCAPEPGAPPLWCWTQLLQGLAAEQAEQADPTDLDPWLVAHLLGPSAGSEASPGGADLRFRLSEAIAVVLQRRARTRPVLLAIDDLQWADDDSVALLGFLARRLATSAVLLLGTYRDAEAGSELRAVVGRAEVHSLLGLDETAVGSLIAQLQGARPEPALAAAVRDRADGNPLFVRELTRLAMARGGWSTPPDPAAASVPDSIAATLRERLLHLSDHCRGVLEVAALVGQESSIEVLALALDEPSDQVRLATEEAVMARVLRPASDGTGWAFVHDLYRSVLAADLPPGRRAALHGAIGEALETRGSNGADPMPAGRLAAHFLASGDRARDRTRTYARLAAADATRRFGHREAVRYLELALRLTDDADRSTRLELLLELGAARHRAGDRGGAIACFRQVAEGSDDPTALARAALGLAALEVRSGTPVDDNVALLRRTIRAVEQSGRSGSEVDGLLSRLYAALARELVHSDLAATRSPDEESIQAADRAVTLADRSGNVQARAAALLARHDALWRPGSAESRLPLLADLITTAAAADDPDLLAESLQLRSAALLELGDPRGVGELRRFVEHAERLGHPRGHWAAVSRRATLLALTGDLDGAAALAAEALEIGREIGVPDADGCFGTTMVSLIIQGRPAQLEPLPADDPVAALAPLLAALSLPEVDHGPAVRAVPVSALLKVYDLESLVAAAPAYARWGSVDQCRDLDAALRPYAGIHAVIGGCAAYYGPVDYYLGLLAAALGEQSRAREHFRTAYTLARRLGAVGWADLAATRDGEAFEDTSASAVLVRQGTTWRLAFAGTEAHLPDAKGLRDIAVLVAAQGQEVHVFTLLGREEPELGADPVLDEEAKRRYRRRIEELQRDIERADQDGDATASQAASAELEALLRELSGATGLGGRDRRLGDEVERARKTVSARIHDTLGRVAAVHPALGSHLEAAVMLGVRCSYRPSEPVAWRLGR
jgi:tetratricopeptide (TPR) repeat protein